MQKIEIKDITDDGIYRDDTITVEEIGLTDQDHLYFVQPVAVQVHLKRIADVILSHVQVKGRYHSTCARSLEVVERDWDADFDLDYQIDADQEELDLVEDIRQEVIMRIPVQVFSNEELVKNSKEKRQPQLQVEDQKGDTHQPFSQLKDLE